MRLKRTMPPKGTKWFSVDYDGTTYRQVYRLDPRLLIPGIMLTLLTVPLVVWTWPVLTPLLIAGLGLLLIVLAVMTRHVLVVSPHGYRLRWSIGPVGWTTVADSNEVEPFVKRGSKGTYAVLLRRGWRTLHPWIEAGSRREGEAWCAFFRSVSAGKPATVPDSDAAWPLIEDR